MHRIFDRAEKVVWTNRKLYYYRQRHGSILHSRGEKLNRDQIFAYEQRLDFLEKDYPELRERMVIRYVNFCIACYCWALKEGLDSLAGDILLKIRNKKLEITEKKYGDMRFRMKLRFRASLFFRKIYMLVYGRNS